MKSDVDVPVLWQALKMDAKKSHSELKRFECSHWKGLEQF